MAPPSVFMRIRSFDKQQEPRLNTEDKLCETTFGFYVPSNYCETASKLFKMSFQKPSRHQNNMSVLFYRLWVLEEVSHIDQSQLTPDLYEVD